MTGRGCVQCTAQGVVAALVNIPGLLVMITQYGGIPKTERADVSHRYAPVGKCIYCGETQGTFGDEHIIPLSLGGRFILPDASCRACEKEINKYERVIGRRVFGRFRIRHNLPTRHKKDRPAELVALAHDGSGGVREVSLPASEYPTEVFTYRYGPPGALLGAPPDVDVWQWEPVGITNHDEMIAFEQKHGGAFGTRVQMVPDLFGRFLAKVGHGYAVAKLGLEAFQPLCLDAILGKKTDNLSYVVGGDNEDKPPPIKSGHVLEVYYASAFERLFAVVRIRLFTGIGMPTYRVIAGEIDINSPKHIRSIPKELINAQRIELALARR